MELFEQLVYPINQTAILAIVGVGFLCRQRYRLALVLLALGAFALVYVIAARFILREEYGYVMRAFTRRRAAA